MGYDLTKRSDLNLTKEDEHYFDPLCRKAKPLTIIIRLEGNWAICLPQFRQISNQKNGSFTTTRQEHHLESQMSALVPSSKVFQ